MNMVVRIKDEFVTPPIAPPNEGSILGGITRDSILTLLREWGFLVSERAVGMEEIISAHGRGELREVFGCGTAAVITPVGELGWKGESLMVNGGKPGEVSRRLFDHITGVQYGRLPDAHGWMTPVE
jgi:branched-chain amino acid aminotransferase